MRLVSCVLSVLACLALQPTASVGQGRPEGLSLGVAVVANDSPFVGGDASVAVLPIIGYDSRAFSLGVLQGLRVTAFDRDDFRLSVIAAPRFFLEIADTEGPALDGIDRNITGEAGLAFDYTPNRMTSMSLRVVQEVTGEHGGQELVLQANRTVTLAGFPVRVGGGLTWQSGDHAEYAWGVRPEEATATRPAYAPGDVLIPNLSIGTFVPITAKTSILATLRVDFLPEAVFESPIVDQEMTTSLFVGITRSF